MPGSINESFSSLQQESTFTHYLVAFLCVFSAVVSLIVWHQKPITILVPWTSQHSAYNSQDYATESYKVIWSIALAQMFGNVNYGDVDLIESRIAPMLPNDSYQSTITALRAQAMQFKDNRITARFEINKYTYEPITDKVFIEGSYYLKAPGIPEKRHKRTYEFIIGMESYMPNLDEVHKKGQKYAFMPQILYMNTYEDVARTQQYLKELEKKGVKVK